MCVCVCVCLIKDKYNCRIKLYHINRNPHGSTKLISRRSPSGLNNEVQLFQLFEKNAIFLGNCVRNNFLMVVMYLYNVVTLLGAVRKIYVQDTTIKLPSRSTDKLGLHDQIMHSQ